MESVVTVGRSGIMQRMVFNTPEELKIFASTLDHSKSTLSRSLAEGCFSGGDVRFTSLVQANMDKVLGALSAAQLDSLVNDEDELEFCPTDSVIADIGFALMLNANREIQVGDLVYKYFSNGVAIVPCEYVAELEDIEQSVGSIRASAGQIGQTLRVAPHVDFIIMDYSLSAFPDYLEDFNQSPLDYDNSNVDNITVGDVSIPASCIRDVNYDDDGDGSWVHRHWTGLFGRNIIACEKFDKKHRMSLHLYHQNYIVYSNIGTGVKMQKKVIGLWWNVKAEEMVQGWDGAIVRYETPIPVSPFSIFHPEMPGATATTVHGFPYIDSSTVLFHVPFLNYDFSGKDFNKVIDTALKEVFKKASAYAQGQVDATSHMGLLLLNDKYHFIVHPYCPPVLFA